MFEAKAARREAIDAVLADAERGELISGDALDAWIDSWDSEGELDTPKADVFPEGR